MRTRTGPTPDCRGAVRIKCNSSGTSTIDSAPSLDVWRMHKHLALTEWLPSDNQTGEVLNQSHPQRDANGCDGYANLIAIVLFELKGSRLVRGLNCCLFCQSSVWLLEKKKNFLNPLEFRIVKWSKLNWCHHQRTSTPSARKRLTSFAWFFFSFTMFRPKSSRKYHTFSFAVGFLACYGPPSTQPMIAFYYYYAYYG